MYHSVCPQYTRRRKLKIGYLPPKKQQTKKQTTTHTQQQQKTITKTTPFPTKKQNNKTKKQNNNKHTDKQSLNYFLLKKQVEVRLCPYIVIVFVFCFFI